MAVGIASSNKRKKRQRETLAWNEWSAARIETCSCSNVNTLFASFWPDVPIAHQTAHHRPRTILSTMGDGGGERANKILPVYDFTSRTSTHTHVGGVIIDERRFSPFLSFFRLILSVFDPFKCPLARAAHTSLLLHIVCLFVCCCCCCRLLSRLGTFFFIFSPSFWPLSVHRRWSWCAINLMHTHTKPRYRMGHLKAFAAVGHKT